MSALSDKNILVCYSASSTFTNTTLEYLNSFSSFLGANVYYLHVTHGSIPQVDLNIFDCVLLSYCSRLCFPGYVSNAFLTMLSRYKGVKAIFIQDEYDYVNNEVEALRLISPDIVFTCIPSDQVPLVYPEEYFPQTEFVRVLTGYVPNCLPKLSLKPLHQRTIDIGYRGRDISYRYGKLGEYKFRVGEAFLTSKNTKDLTLDIRMDEDSRIYGVNWFKWLSNCKATLGSPSGSNIFDFDGSIAEAFKDASGRKSRVSKSILERIDQLDNMYSMDQISPRVFEATAMGCSLIMIKGDYSDILTPGVHYLPIEPDYSNISDILDSARDTNLLSSMAERAYSDLLSSDLYTYKSFASLVGNKLRDRITQKDCHIKVPLAPEFVDTGANPHHELPTLQPMFFDTFKLKSLLISLSDDYERFLFKLFFGQARKVVIKLIQTASRILRLFILPFRLLLRILVSALRKYKNSRASYD